ncbi:MAG: aldo/keto reductase [Devosia sp.]|uniref:aldo/keto reductase n=1 Tax=Devosia sp. TaxID=1871048 RepID=UPI001A52368E|nr:aldo/keto reductase [Devosia sp.]MBL8598947.1 aldo/keto reductase [Devosia sp.]
MSNPELLPRRLLGGTGLSMSILGFGGVQVGDYFVKISEQVAAGAITQAWDEGIRYFDTAPQYGKGLSEHRIGTWLRQYPRDAFVLSTKVGRRIEPDPALCRDPERRGLPFRLVVDFSYDGTKRAIEDSLNRLALSHIDIAYIHDLEPRTFGVDYPAYFREAIGGCYRALDDLRSEGVIAGIGGGINEADASVKLMEAVPLDCLLLAGRYTLLEQQTLDSVMSLAVKQGVGIVIGAPFNSGVLATGAVADARYNNQPLEPALRAHVQQLEQICRRHCVPLPAAALQFTLAHPAVVSVVAGMANAEEVIRNRKLVAWSIPAEFWSELRDAGLIRTDAPLPAASPR